MIMTDAFLDFLQVVHQGMRSYFFSADTQEDMLGWVRALSQSASMETDGSLNRYTRLVWTNDYKHSNSCSPFLWVFMSFQALFKLSGFHEDRWQHWISGSNKAHLWWRGCLPEAQTHQQDPEWAQPPDWWEDGDNTLGAQGKEDHTSEKQQVVWTAHVCGLC